MQMLIGVIVLITVLTVSVAISYNIAKDKYPYYEPQDAIMQFLYTILLTFGCTILGYVILGVFGIFFWIIALIGIWLRQILQWVLESMLAPFQAFLDLLT